jgi:hypothetical protein
MVDHLDAECRLKPYQVSKMMMRDDFLKTAGLGTAISDEIEANHAKLVALPLRLFKATEI